MEQETVDNNKVEDTAQWDAFEPSQETGFVWGVFDMSTLLIFLEHTGPVGRVYLPAHP